MSLDTTLAAQHAARWANALTSDTGDAVALYADDLVYDDHADSDHVTDTAITKAELRPRLAPFANTDPGNGVGVHTFTATEAFQLAGVNGNPAVVILWDWTGEGLATFRGVPTGGKTLQTRGITWQQLDSEGKIARETTYWNDTPPVLQELGLPIITPEYWVEGFDRPRSRSREFGHREAFQPPRHVGGSTRRPRPGLHVLRRPHGDRGRRPQHHLPRAAAVAQSHCQRAHRRRGFRKATGSGC